MEHSQRLASGNSTFISRNGVDGRGVSNRLFGEASRLEWLDRKINKEWATASHVCTTTACTQHAQHTKPTPTLWLFFISSSGGGVCHPRPSFDDLHIICLLLWAKKHEFQTRAVGSGSCPATVVSIGEKEVAIPNHGGQWNGLRPAEGGKKTRYLSLVSPLPRAFPKRSWLNMLHECQARI